MLDEGSRMYFLLYLSGGKNPGVDADLTEKNLNSQYNNVFFFDSNARSTLQGFSFLRNSRAYRKRII